MKERLTEEVEKFYQFTDSFREQTVANADARIADYWVSRFSLTIQEELKKSNELLRSAYAIAMRYGQETNWKAFLTEVAIELNRQDKILKL